ncbi:MAG: tetratricopeptide repeat protein [Candidatus Protochlamydia sp.]|nr:tetratricopeptide repeat protein [Candidatus Protochlamydia sp.]
MKSVGDSSPYSGSYPIHQNNAPKSPLQNTLNLHEKCANTSCKNLPVNLSRCGGCKQVYYCSQDCQRQEWKAHKAACKMITSQTNLQETKETKAYPAATVKTTSKATPLETPIGSIEEANAVMQKVRILFEEKKQVDQVHTLLLKLVVFDQNFFTKLGIHKEEDTILALAVSGLLVNRGYLNQAVELLNKVIEFNPHTSIVHSVYDCLAQIYFLKKDLGKQQHYLEIAFDLSPESETCTRLVNLLKAQGKLDEAEKLLRKAIKLNPKNIEAFFELGEILYQKKQWKQAEDFMNLVIKFNPTHAPAYHLLGKLTMLGGKITEGLSFIQNALILDPHNIEYHQDLNKFLKISILYNNVIDTPELENQMKSMQKVIVPNSKAFDLLNHLVHKEDLVLGAQVLKKKLIGCDNENLTTLLEWITKSEFNYDDLNIFSESDPNKQLLERLSKNGFSDEEKIRFSQLLKKYVINNR